MNLGACDQISAVDKPLTWTPEKDALFLEAVREMAIFQSDHNPVIARLYAKKGFMPSHLRHADDLARLPVVGVTAMKKHLLLTRPADRAALMLTSSGTRGLKTQIWFDDESLSRVQKMLDVLFEQEGFVGKEPCNAFVFSYDPSDAKDLGVAFTSKNQLRFSPVLEVAFGVKKNAQGQWTFDTHRAMSIFDDFARSASPLRLLGMPAFLFGFLEAAREAGRSWTFPAESLVLTGGGWKAAEDKKVTREQFRELITEVFGIPDHRIRDGFGMAEHSAPYFECAAHRFHVPVYNRMIIRNPETFAVLPPGQTGLMELVTPFNTMMHNLAILTTDWASLDPDPCPCGQRSPTFQLRGRAGQQKHKGCAIHAEDIVSRRQS